MWSFFKRDKQTQRGAKPQSWFKKLRFQQFEPRHSLSAASITGFTVAPQTGTTVLVSGYVADEDPASVSVQIGGVVSGQTSVNAQGYFQLTQQATNLGSITAVAHDNEGLDSQPATTQLASSIPTISGFTVTPTNNGKQVTVTGTVNDESAGNRPVTLSGVVSGTLTTNSSGVFTGTLEASSLGTVSATVTDIWGQVSSAALATLTSAAPSISGFSVMETGMGRMVSLTGTVMDEAPNGRTVTFTGVVAGSTTSVMGGSFAATYEASGLGTVSATVTDVWGQTSSAATATLSSAAPTVSVNAIEAGGGKYVTLTGTVSDSSPSGRVVTFGGVVSGSATTNAQGQYSVTLLASQLGQITATTTDVWGQASNTAQTTLTSAAPTITNLTATEGLSEFWTFTGTVTDEKYYGLTVSWSGLFTATSTVGSNGSFSIARQIAVGAVGNVYASLADWWGQASNTAQVTVVNT